VCFCIGDGFITEFIVPNVFINLVILSGISVSCTEDKGYVCHVQKIRDICVMYSR
jgi:hypothetical protein